MGDGLGPLFLSPRSFHANLQVSRKRVFQLDPEQADYLAMLTWIEAQRPEFAGREKTLEKIAVLDKCLKLNENCERALFWRGMLYKRIDEASKAIQLAAMAPKTVHIPRLDMPTWLNSLFS